MLPDTTSLALFVNAVELGSISKAAEVSHIALAAASRRISLLEHHYRVKLLTRTSQGVEPTAAGRAALLQARQMLNLMRKLDADLVDYARGVKGHIRIHANMSALAQFLADDFAAFAAAHPDVRLDLEERLSSEILQSIRDGSADVGIIVEGQGYDDVCLLDYRQDNLVAIAPTAFNLRQKAIDFAELLRHDFVALESSTALTRRLQLEALGRGQVLRLRVQVRSFEAVCRMVEAGLGVAILPENVVRPYVEGRRVRALQLKDGWAQRRMQICVRSLDALPQIGRQLVDHLQQQARRPKRQASRVAKQGIASEQGLLR